MPKKKRTRKQKIQTEQKRQMGQAVMTPRASSQANNPPSEQQQQETTTSGISFSLPASYAHKQASAIPTHPKPTPSVTITTNEYSYLSKDLIKTSLLTITIIVLECLIRFMYPMS